MNNENDGGEIAAEEDAPVFQDRNCGPPCHTPSHHVPGQHPEGEKEADEEERRPKQRSKARHVLIRPCDLEQSGRDGECEPLVLDPLLPKDRGQADAGGQERDESKGQQDGDGFHGFG